ARRPLRAVALARAHVLPRYGRPGNGARRAPSTTPEVFRELQSDHGPHARDLVRDGQHREGHVRCMCAADECGRGEAGAVAGSAGGNPGWNAEGDARSEEHTSELQSRFDLVCRLLLEKKKKTLWRSPWRYAPVATY